MSPKTDRDDARRKREEARSRRRKPDQESQEPSPEGPSEEQEATDGGDGGLDSLRGAATVAAAGAAVGAAFGAARALTSRNGHDQEQHPEEREQPEAEDEPDAKADPEPQPERAPELEAEPEPGPRRDAVGGASPDEAGEAVRRARSQLQALHGAEPESVSSLERTGDGWRATFEVVELARIPDSTDVLASYEVVLDQNLNVTRYGRLRRYYRAQADHEGMA